MTSSALAANRFQRIGAPGLFVVLWATGFIGAKYGLPYAEPLTFLSWRYGFVTLIFLAMTLLVGAPWPSSRAQVLHIAVSGMLVNAVYIGGVFCAIYQGVPAGIVSLIVGLQPLFTAVLASRILGEKVYPRQWFGFLLGLAGMFLVLGDKISFAGGNTRGILLCLLALFGMTAGTLYQKRFCVAMDLRSGAVIQFGASTLAMVFMASLLEKMQVVWSGRFIFAMSWLVIILSVGAVTLLNMLIRRGEASRVASLFYLVPPFTLLAFFCFQEKLGASALVGMAVCVTGVALAIKR